jgi:hypothetical protein
MRSNPRPTNYSWVEHYGHYHTRAIWIKYPILVPAFFLVMIALSVKKVWKALVLVKFKSGAKQCYKRWVRSAKAIALWVYAVSVRTTVGTCLKVHFHEIFWFILVKSGLAKRTHLGA